MITFKPHSREEIPLRIKWLNNRLANKYAIEDPDHSTDLKEQTKWFNDLENNPAKKFFTIFSGNEPIGFMGLSRIDQPKGTGELFIMIGEDAYRGKGIGKISMKYLIDYACKELKLNKILLEVNKNNSSAISLYKSLGFKENKPIGDEIEMELSL